MATIPAKLQKGDEVRVIAPGQSLKIISKDNIHCAQRVLEALGLNVTFGKHVKECDEMHSSAIESRIKYLHEAFSDDNVKAVLTMMGGFNSNQLLYTHYTSRCEF